MHLYYCGQDLSDEERENVTGITIDANAIHHRIPDKAFESCERLIRVDIPDSITEIGYCAFADCVSLSDIRLPQSLTSIGADAFYECYSLTCIHIPDSVSKIGECAFFWCKALRHVNIPHGLTEIQQRTFCGCESLTHIDVPDGVITIGEEVFCDCTSLTHVNLPSGLRTLMDGAFSGCTSLEQIHIPEGVEEIDDGTFRGCSSLLYVYIPQSVHYIDRTAFEISTLDNQYHQVYPNEQSDGDASDGEISGDKFHDWLRTRYDDYPFLKTCWKKHVTMVDIAQCVEEHGMDCLLQVEKGTGWNGLDILLLNQYVGGDSDALGLIADIILMLLWQKGSN